MSSSYTNTKQIRTGGSKLSILLRWGILGIAVIVTIAAAYQILNNSESDTSEREEYIRKLPYGSLEELSQPERFIAAYLEAQGGRENLGTVNTIVVAGKVEFQGEEINFKIYRKRPNLFRISQDAGDKNITTAYNGKDVWQRIRHPSQPDKTRLLEGREKADWLRQTPFFDWIINAYYGDGKITGPIVVTTYDSQEVLQVRVEDTHGDVSEFLVDPNTMKIVLDRSQSEQGKIIENVFSDYIEVRGMHIASKITMRVDGEYHSQTEIKSADVNSGLLADFFEAESSRK